MHQVTEHALVNCQPLSNSGVSRYTPPKKQREKTPYAELLRDPRWLRKRAEILELHGCACFHCHKKTNCLQVHHRYYISRRMPWEYPNWALVPLCDDGCHKKIQDRHAQGWEDWEELGGLFADGTGYGALPEKEFLEKILELAAQIRQAHIDDERTLDWLNLVVEQRSKERERERAGKLALRDICESRTEEAPWATDCLHHFWKQLVVAVRNDRKLISAWLEAASQYSGDGDVIYLYYTKDNAFAADFLEGSHQSFLDECAARIHGHPLTLKFKIQ